MKSLPDKTIIACARLEEINYRQKQEISELEQSVCALSAMVLTGNKELVKRCCTQSVGSQRYEIKFFISGYEYGRIQEDYMKIKNTVEEDKCTKESS